MGNFQHVHTLLKIALHCGTSPDLVASHAERIGIRKALDLGGLQRGHRTAIVEPDVLVELLRQAGPEVVARELGFGPVDDADCSLEPLLAEAGRPA